MAIIRIQLRRDTAAQWAAVNPVLAIGEPGVETDTGKQKIGNGATAWSALPYSSGEKGDPGQDGADGADGVADDASVAALVTSTGATKTALNATFGLVGGVPIEGYDIVILAGQSNMSGRGTLFSATLDPDNGRIFQYKGKAPNANTIIAAAEPLDMHDTPSGIGPGLQFARWYAARKLAGNRKILLVPVAHGGTPLVSTAALGWRRGVAGNLYANMVAKAQGALVAGGAGSRIVAALWLQGETDGDNNVTGPTYQTDFDALINGLRTDLGIPDLPFILGTMVPEYLTTGTRSQINAVQRATPNRIAKVDVAVSATAMHNGDGNHFNAPGQRFNGKAMYDAYERVSQGIAPYSETYVTPAQVTGLTAGTPTSSSVPLSWSAVSGSTSYLMEYRATGGSTWLSGGTVTGTSGTVTGLAQTTGYDFRVSAANAATTGAPSATVTATTVVASTVLGLTGAAATYSLRKLGTAYSGSAVKVRRSTDSTTQDIGFSGSNLDTAALLTFAGAGDAFVDTWYDQSGNGRHISQPTTTKQPKLVAAGAVLTSGGKPAAQFDGTDDNLFTNTVGIYALGAATHLAVVNGPSQGLNRIISEANTADNNMQYSPMIAAATTAGFLGFQINVAASLVTDTASVAPALLTGAIAQASVVDTGTNLAGYVNATAVRTVAYARTGTPVLNNLAIGAMRRVAEGQFFNGLISEVVIFAGALSTTNRQSAEADQKAFYGTP